MKELEKQEGTSSMLHQAMSISSKPSLNSNGSFSLETLNSGENRRLFSFVILKFDGWSCKTVGHFLYVTSSFVHYFTTIGEFKLELQSRNAQLESKSVIFRPVRPWNLTDDLENNWVPSLYYFKLCASFHSHQWIHTRVTVRKRPIWVKIGDCLSHVTLKCDGWSKKQ